MNEKTLRNIAIILSVVGLILLFYTSENLKEKVRTINSITEKDIGTFVKVCGEVNKKNNLKGGHILLELIDDNSTINVIIFNKTAEILNIKPYIQTIKKNDNICVSGKVNKYNEKLEIICNKVEFNENVF